MASSNTPLLGNFHETRPRRESSNGFLSNLVRGGLFSPPALTYDPLLLLLNHDDKKERDRLTDKWKDNKLQELNFVGVVVRAT